MGPRFPESHQSHREPSNSLDIEQKRGYKPQELIVGEIVSHDVNRGEAKWVFDGSL
jgi:hypothetical protein